MNTTLNLDQLQKDFTRLYEMEVDTVFRFCLLRVAPRDEALDIVQEAFTRLWQSLQKGVKVENVRAFLFKVTHNLIVDWYRRKKPISLESLSDSSGEEVYEPMDNDSYERAEQSAEGRYLLGKFALIKSLNRRAVYLRFVEGMSPPEIGKALGLTANAVSVRVNRGLDELRKMTGYDKTS